VKERGPGWPGLRVSELSLGDALLPGEGEGLARDLRRGRELGFRRIDPAPTYRSPPHVALLRRPGRRRGRSSALCFLCLAMLAGPGWPREQTLRVPAGGPTEVVA